MTMAHLILPPENIQDASQSTKSVVISATQRMRQQAMSIQIMM